MSELVKSSIFWKWPTAHDSKEIKPTQFKKLLDTGIYPTSSSVWQDGTSTYTNETTTGASKLLDVLTNEGPAITLIFNLRLGL